MEAVENNNSKYQTTEILKHQRRKWLIEICTYEEPYSQKGVINRRQHKDPKILWLNQT